MLLWRMMLMLLRMILLGAVFERRNIMQMRLQKPSTNHVLYDVGIKVLTVSDDAADTADIADDTADIADTADGIADDTAVATESRVDATRTRRRSHRGVVDARTRFADAIGWRKGRMSMQV